MNRIGGKSNSGEGEDPVRFKRREDGDWANSAIKQIASGRFGVTAAYLASAKEIEIKWHKEPNRAKAVNYRATRSAPILPACGMRCRECLILRLRITISIRSRISRSYLRSQAGQSPRPRLCEVAEAGVGTIAAGVAKAHADIILVSGHEGGTGASPLSSIKNAGGAWEMGVAETHQVLLLNGLRNRVTLRTDGGMRSVTISFTQPCSEQRNTISELRR